MRELNLPVVSGFEPYRLREAVTSSFCSMDYEVSADGGSDLTMFDGARFGAIDVLHYGGRGTRRGTRRVHHIRSDPADHFLLTLPVRARVDVSQLGMDVHLEPGSFALLSTTRPFDAAIASTALLESFSAIQVRVSAGRLRERVPHADDCCDHRIQLESGAGQIMLRLFEAALHEGPKLSSTQADLFAGILIDAVANAILEAPELIHLQQHNVRAGRERLRHRIDHCIRSQLSNPNLNAELIADRCQVSVRRLREIFSACNETLTGFIREQRLLRCRDALRAPSLRGRTVFEIALQWGFNDPAYFSRAYRDRFGVSPTDERRGVIDR